MVTSILYNTEQKDNSSMMGTLQNLNLLHTLPFLIADLISRSSLCNIKRFILNLNCIQVKWYFVSVHYIIYLIVYLCTSGNAPSVNGLCNYILKFNILKITVTGYCNGRHRHKCIKASHFLKNWVCFENFIMVFFCVCTNMDVVILVVNIFSMSNKFVILRVGI